MAQRFDHGELKLDAKRTPQGFLRCDAVIARTGIQVYRLPDGKDRREYRPPEEVFKADALASASQAPITFTPETWNWHPQEKVTPANARKYAVGWTGTEAKADGNLVKTTAIIMDAAAIAAAESGAFAQLSCGYEADLEMTAGTSPEGEKYDAIQRNIKVNHVAMVKHARAGPEARLKLDSNDNAVQDAATTEGRREMEKITIGGVTFEVSPQVKQAIEAKFKADADALVAAQAGKDAAAALVTTEKARADAAEGKLAVAEKARADASDPKVLDAAVARRVTLLGTARAHLGAEFKADGKSEELIKREVLAKVAPTIKLDGQSEAYVTAVFDTAVALAKPAGARPLVYDTGEARTDADDTEAVARAAMRKAHKERLPSLVTAAAAAAK